VSQKSHAPWACSCFPWPRPVASNGPRSTRNKETVVELIIASIAIISLIATLFTATDSTRQNARITACASNLVQHSQGTANFAAANDGAMPNAPSSPGGDFADRFGPRGHPAFRFATTDRPINGFAFGEEGIRTMGHPSGPPTFLTNTDRWMNRDQSLSQFYWVVLGEFMVDGTATDAMREVFHSPSDEQGRTEWDVFIEWVRNERQGAMPSLPERAGFIAPIMEGHLNQLAPQGISNGSYLYPSSMFCTPEIWLHSPRNGAPVNVALNEKWGHFDAAGDSVVTVENYHQVVRRNRMSDFLFPTNKVAFFLDRAVHNPDIDFWFQPGARTTIAHGDGSVRVVEPAQAALASDKQRNDGPVHKLVYKGPDNPGASPFTTEGEGAIEIPFIATYGGLRGRDLH